MRYPAGFEKVTMRMPSELLDRLDEQSERWTIGPSKLMEIGTAAAVGWLEQHDPGRKLPPLPVDSLNSAVASAMMESMEPIRTVPKPNTISSIDGEDIATGPEPGYPEADAPLMDGSRPETEPSTPLLLDTE